MIVAQNHGNEELSKYPFHCCFEHTLGMFYSELFEATVNSQASLSQCSVSSICQDANDQDL